MKFFFFITFCFFLIQSNAQNPSILSQNVIGGTGNDSGAIRVNIPFNSNYFLVCHSNSNISGDKTENSRGFHDLWLLKLDFNNTIIWNKTLGGDSFDFARSAVLFNNKLYILSTSSSSISGEKSINNFSSFSDYWLLCLDLDGNILWQTIYGGTDTEEALSMNILQNNNLILSGVSNSNISGNKTENSNGGYDLWVIEVDPNNGDIVDQKTIGSSGDDEFNTLYQTISGDIILMGSSPTGISGDKTDMGYGSNDIWLIKLDENYTILNDKCFGGADQEFGGMILEDNSVYYIISTSSSGVSGNKSSINQYSGFGSFFYDVWLMKLDANLNMLWDKSFGGYDNEYGGLIYKHSFNKLLIGATSFSPVSGNKTSAYYGAADSWMLILDLEGNIITQETYGGSQSDYALYLPTLLGDGHLYFHGISESGISGVKTLPSKGGFDIWLMELDASDFLNTEKLSVDASTISVYPNPFNEIVYFKLNNLTEEVELTIASLDGKIVEKRQILPCSEVIEAFSSHGEQFLVYSVKGETINFHGKLVSH